MTKHLPVDRCWVCPMFTVEHRCIKVSQPPYDIADNIAPYCPLPDAESESALAAMTARAEKAEAELGLEEPAADSPMGMLTHQLMIVGQERDAAVNRIPELLAVIDKRQCQWEACREALSTAEAKLKAVEDTVTKWGEDYRQLKSGREFYRYAEDIRRAIATIGL